MFPLFLHFLGLGGVRTAAQIEYFFLVGKVVGSSSSLYLLLLVVVFVIPHITSADLCFNDNASV